MSLYWICMGNETIQPVLQPLVNGPTVPNLKLASDFVSTPIVCHKMLTPPNFLLPTDAKSSGTNSNASQAKQGHYHIFVGDLSPDVETHHLQAAFTQFGQTSDCKIIRDQQTLKSKGYGFVSFVNKEDAETAIVCMNGQWIGNRAIRTNWAIRKPPNATNIKDAIQRPLTYEEVYNQSSATNTTVYCGGILIGLTEELIHKTFGAFGFIEEVRVFKEKGYAFIRFSNKESAIQAIVAIHGSEVNGQPVKCSWGKEPNESSPCSGTSPTQVAIVPVAAVQSQTNSSPGFYSGQRGYWTYPLTPNYQQLSNLGFIQPCIQQNFSYGNFGLPTVQWPPTSCNSSSQPLPPFGGHQQPLVAYPPQPGFQQA